MHLTLLSTSALVLFRLWLQGLLLVSILRIHIVCLCIFMCYVKQVLSSEGYKQLAIVLLFPTYKTFYEDMTEYLYSFVEGNRNFKGLTGEPMTAFCYGSMNDMIIRKEVTSLFGWKNQTLNPYEF